MQGLRRTQRWPSPSASGAPRKAFICFMVVSLFASTRWSSRSRHGPTRCAALAPVISLAVHYGRREHHDEPDGSVVICARLPAEDGALVLETLQATADRL
jgi:hypothetical protein